MIGASHLLSSLSLPRRRFEALCNRRSPTAELAPAQRDFVGPFRATESRFLFRCTFAAWESSSAQAPTVAACRSRLNFSHSGLFFYNMLNLWTVCCTEMSELDGSSVVEVLDCSFKAPWFNSQISQNFACQFFSAVPQIFVFLVSVPCQFLRLLPLLRPQGLRSHGNLQGTRRQPGVQQIVYSGLFWSAFGHVCVFWKRMVPSTNSLKHAAACRSMPACCSEPRFSWGLLVPAHHHYDSMSWYKTQ